MEFTLAFPTAGQVEQISLIWEHGWHEAHAQIVPQKLRELRTSQSFRDRAIENLSSTRVAIDRSNVLGFCMVKNDELYQMYVSHEARGSITASALIKDAEHRIRSKGYSKAWLACAVGNERAIRFYQKSGWTNVGLRVVDLDTSVGTFPLEVWKFEKALI